LIKRAASIAWNIDADTGHYFTVKSGLQKSQL